MAAVKAIENRTVFTNIESFNPCQMIMLGFRSNGPQELDIIFLMELAKIFSGIKNLHVMKQAVLGKQGISHCDSLRFHGVIVTVVIVANFRVIKVTNLSLHAVSL